MPSALDLAKRALVTLLRALAVTYGVPVDVSRDLEDAEVRRAYRTVSRKVHPDRGADARLLGDRTLDSRMPAPKVPAEQSPV